MDYEEALWRRVEYVTQRLRLDLSRRNHELTLIIPTFGRPQFLTRLLDYLRQQRFTHEIAVADSSPSEAAESNRHLIAQQNAFAKIRYAYFDQTTRLC